MKKLFALMLALCLLASFALADGQELVWDANAAAQYEGDFVTFDEIAVKIWIPAEFQQVELSDEEKEGGYIGYYATEGAAIAVVYVDVDGMSLEEYQAKLEDSEGVSEVEGGSVNGLPCVGYKNDDNVNLAFATQMGYILEITVGPLSNEDDETKASFVLASIQAAE